MHFVIPNLPVSNKHLEQFKEKSQKDPILLTLLTYTIEAWLEETFIPHQFQPYFTHRSDISYHKRLLLKDQEIIVPSAL